MGWQVAEGLGHGVEVHPPRIAVPGEKLVRFSAKHPTNARLVERGLVVELADPPKPSKPSSKKTAAATKPQPDAPAKSESVGDGGPDNEENPTSEVNNDSNGS